MAINTVNSFTHKHCFQVQVVYTVYIQNREQCQQRWSRA